MEHLPFRRELHNGAKAVIGHIKLVVLIHEKADRGRQRLSPYFPAVAGIQLIDEHPGSAGIRQIQPVFLHE